MFVFIVFANSYYNLPIISHVNYLCLLFSVNSVMYIHYYCYYMVIIFELIQFYVFVSLHFHYKINFDFDMIKLNCFKS